MSAISKILLPVDFSPRGAGAARYAAALAHHFNAEVTMLHVLERFDWVPPSAWEYSGEFQADAEQAFREQRNRDLENYGKEEFGGLNVKRVMTAGNVSDQIIQQARKDE